MLRSKSTAYILMALLTAIVLITIICFARFCCYVIKGSLGTMSPYSTKKRKKRRQNIELCNMNGNLAEQRGRHDENAVTSFMPELGVVIDDNDVEYNGDSRRNTRLSSLISSTNTFGGCETSMSDISMTHRNSSCSIDSQYLDNFENKDESIEASPKRFSGVSLLHPDAAKYIIKK